MSSFKVSGRRSGLARLTPVGIFMVIFAVGGSALLVVAGLQWALNRLPEATPAAVAAELERTATLTAEPTATLVVTETAGFPAWWAEGMYQDAAGAWWPTEDAREQVQTMVEEQYRECSELVGGNDIEVFENTKTEDVRKCYTGEMLDGWFRAWKNYTDNGTFNTTTELEFRQTYPPRQHVRVRHSTLPSEFQVVGAATAPFLTTLQRFLDVRCLPLGHPGDFPRGLGGLVGVPISAKISFKLWRTR